MSTRAASRASTACSTNPKFEIVVADGRHALALDTTRYDVIEADAILPKTALSGLLNSQEFFRQVRAKLAPGGIYVQWAPTERSIETFRSVFPYVTMVHPALLGSDRPIPYARDKILALLARPEIDAHLAAARDRPRRTAEMVRGQEDRGAERRQGRAGARRPTPTSFRATSTTSIVLDGRGSLMSRATSGRRSRAPMRSASSKVRSSSKRISGALRRPAFSLDPGAEPRRRAAQGGEQPLARPCRPAA